MVEYLQAQVGHPYLVDVGESQGERHVNNTMIFSDRVDLIAYISAGTLNLREPLRVEHKYAPLSYFRPNTRALAPSGRKREVYPESSG